MHARAKWIGLPDTIEIHAARYSAPYLASSELQKKGPGSIFRLVRARKIEPGPFFLTAMSDDHSELEPPLPIPNRAVKRLSADDSADYPCESRTSSGTTKDESPDSSESGLLFLWPSASYLTEATNGRARP